MWCDEVLPDARNSAHSCQPMLSRYLKKEDNEDEEDEEDEENEENEENKKNEKKGEVDV